MAIMFPRDIHPDAPHSERVIFDVLKRSAISRDWVVYHSEYLENPKNPSRPREIDFVILIPAHFTVICLESKGGRYETIEAGRKWRSLSNPNTILDPAPPEKARQDMYKLQETLRNTRFDGRRVLSDESLISYGCAVALPHGDFPEGARQPRQALILQGSDISVRNPDRTVRKLADYAELAGRRVRERTDRPGNRALRLLDKALTQWDNLRNYLEYDVVITRDLRTIRSRSLETLRPQLLRLTEEQIVSLDAPDLNEYCVIDGAAGTGKTVLALELARRRCEDDGKRVALMCNNPVLSQRFDRWARTLSDENGGSVAAGTPITLPLHAFDGDSVLGERHMRRMADASGLEDSLKGSQADSRWRNFTDETLADLPDGGSFDYLVVDEAQNLTDDAFLDLMDGLLVGGLADGNWTMFGDFTNQNLVSPDIPTDGRQTLRERGLRPANSRMRTNCRNTEEIALETARYSRVAVDTMSGVYGPEVLAPQYFDTNEELGDILESWIKTWRGNRIQASQITLLSTCAEDEFRFDTDREYDGLKLVNVREDAATDIWDIEKALVVSGGTAAGAIRYSDVYDFQGLESDVVVLVLPRPEGRALVAGELPWRNEDHLRRVLYTGMSRAKAMLLIVAHTGYKTTLDLLPVLYDSLYT